MVKKKVTVSIDEELLKWVYAGVESKKFGSVSHAMNLALSRMFEMEDSVRSSLDHVIAECNDQGVDA